MKKSLLILIISLFTLSFSQTDSNNEIVVGIKETPPFIIENPDGSYSGVSIDLWEEISTDLGLNYSYKKYDLTGLLNALENDEIDLCINPLTVTSKRVQKFDFTQPFYITNLAIASSKESSSSIWLFIENLFSLDFIKAVLLLFVVILVFGILGWLFERKHNPEEFEKGIKGLWSGIWWSAVTMTTVGYGDKSPRSTGGRIVALVWMFTAIIIISGFTASIASSLTVNKLGSKIKNTDDLKRAITGTVENSSSAFYLRENGISYETFQTSEEGLNAVFNGTIDAFVYDEPIMKFLIRKENLESKVAILPNKFNKQYYSFSLPKDNQLLDKINPLLLNEINDVKWKAILSEYNLLE